MNTKNNMWHYIYKHLVPKSRLDLCVKIALFCSAIAAFNVGFYRIYPHAPALPIRYLIVQAFVVGGPFVILFFMILMKQVSLQATLVRLARYDMLTNLPNRRYFLKRAEAAVQCDKSSVLLLLDIDHFKTVNDTWGHAVGDKCLESVGHILGATIRSDDLVGRLGGEEFAILLRNTKLEKIEYLTSKLLKPLPFNGGTDLQHLTVTMSIGAGEIEKGGSIEAAIIEADRALYRAKANGRARVEFAA